MNNKFKIIKQWKKHNFNYVYIELKKIDYVYTLENIEKDFSEIKKEGDRYLYFIYLLSKENTPENIILLCECLMFTDTCFYDVYSVIGMFIRQALIIYPHNKKIVNWAIDMFDNHPDSPFGEDEMQKFKEWVENEEEI